jgi:hypothetical protein
LKLHSKKHHDLYSKPNRGDQIEVDEMSGVHDIHKKENKFIQGFGGKT